MNVNVSHATAIRQRGITLLEVLISLGILSVGLASVVALIPAGGSQAKKSVIEDRRGAMASAALADIVTRGMLNKSRWLTNPAPPYLIDPIGAGSFTVPGLNPITINGLASGPVIDEVFRAQDDVVYVVPDDDGPAIPKFFNGPAKRMTEGSFSWLATLVPLSATGPFYRLSVIEFHRRPVPSALQSRFPLAAPKPATDQYLAFPINPAILSDDFKSLFPVGTVVLCVDASMAICEWRRVLMAAATETSGLVTAVELTVDRDVPANVTDVHVLEGAVGMAERTVRLEEMSPWSQ